eukprot:765236-Hanusia_phi.AAC.2
MGKAEREDEERGGRVEAGVKEECKGFSVKMRRKTKLYVWLEEGRDCDILCRLSSDQHVSRVIALAMVSKETYDNVMESRCRTGHDPMDLGYSAGYRACRFGLVVAVEICLAEDSVFQADFFRMLCEVLVTLTAETWSKGRSRSSRNPDGLASYSCNFLMRKYR